MRGTWVLLVLLLLAVCAQAATRISDIDLSDKSIKETDNFKIEITVKSPRSGMIIDFYVDDDYVNSVNVGSSRDEYESNKIDLREEPVGCGSHTAKAILKYRDSEEVISQLSLDFSVGNLPDITTEPAKPNVNKDVRIRLTDQETGAPVVGVKVEILNQKRIEKRITKGSTNIDGTYTYTPPNYGRYEITVDDSKYCGKTYFDAKNNLRVDGPHPENPVVGELIHIAVPIGVGVKVVDAEGDVYLRAMTTIGGGANFTINDSGGYTLVIGDLSSRYWGINKSINVSARPIPEITFSPGQAVSGRSVSISVISRDEPLADASVTISGPDKSFDSFVTPSSGALAFTPMAVGEYTIRVEKPRYDSVSKPLMVKNELYVDLEPKVPAVGGNITVVVRNQLGHVVAGVAILLDGEEMGITDAGGRYKLMLPEPKNYTITASKRDIRYWDAKVNVTPATELRIELGDTLLRVGETTGITVYDKLDAEVETALSVKDPAGKTTQLAEATFTPESRGTYTIIASKGGYGTTTKDVTVEPNAISVDWNTEGRHLVLKISSGGQPLPGITVRLIEPIQGDLATTGDGSVRIPLKSSGRYNIEVNKANNNPDYESKAENRVIKKDYRILLPLVLIAVILALAAAAIFILHRKIGRGGAGGKTVQTKLPGKTSLRNV